ncbi:FAD-dependent oxidoreductase [Geodermatophilus normandii]|uniref:FAD-dependent monooxygenase n=1 Tax=Geodermatophilus normandii TaxID=1137989 RepID=A0A6P0GGN0_9ACTN|nr:FAD-dependent monooxygenase [Geodermatophilus normandii]NEM06410.1 FAD-dependent monooxygenase [Geodermatophilus normandii]
MAETHVAQQPGTGHAVVIGASMAGLLAARVLAGHVDRVTVVERDRLPDEVEQRKGVPQGRQLHVLLARGLAVLDRLFPGFGRDLEAAGAVPVRLPGDVLLSSKAGWIDRRAPGWTMLSASRPLIEATLRRRLLQLPGVAVLDGCEVTGLRASDDSRLVHGVSVRRVDGGDDVRSVDADLVVDASGRGSRAAHWLADLGYPEPGRTQVDSHIAYASRLYRIPDGFAEDWRAVILMARPPHNPRSGFLLPIEGGRWILGLMGAAGQHPPTDEAGFTAFTRELSEPVIAETLARAEPVSDIRGHRGTAGRLAHFERLPRWPERLVVLGDAVCAFNPVYGQGITTAAIAAESLDACLLAQRRRRPAGDLDGLAGRFQRELARRNADPWMLSTGEDLRYPSTTGMTASRVLRAQHRYFDRVEIAATTDPAVTEVYARVFGMLDRPTALFRPRILTTALRTRPVTVEQMPASAPVAAVPAPRAPMEQRSGVRAR